MRVIAGRRTGPLVLLLLCTAGLALGGLWWARAYGTGPSATSQQPPAEPVPAAPSSPAPPPTAAGEIVAAPRSESPAPASESAATQSSEAVPPSSAEPARPAPGPRARKPANHARPAARKIYRELDF